MRLAADESVLRPVVIAEGFDGGQPREEVAYFIDNNEDVDRRLGGQARNSGTTNVLNR